MPSAPAIGFEYRPSRHLRRALLAVAGLAVLAVWLCALPASAKVAVSGMVLVVVAHAARRVARTPVTAAGCSEDGQWTLHMSADTDVIATLSSFRVLGGFVLLRLRTTDQDVHTLLLGPDNADADIRRRLRMRLAMLRAREVPAAG
jgi:toxin CptA